MHKKSFRMRSNFFSFFMIVIVCASASHDVAARQSYFVMDEVPSDNLTPFPKWKGMMGRFDDQRTIPDSECGKVQFHPCVIGKWKALVANLRDASLESKLHKINNWGNAHPYIVDQLNWGMIDYWETPYEFMQVNGDCEDYAIAKYYSLRAAGVPAEQMRIIVLQDLNLGGIIHAILTVYDGSKMWVLDNQIAQVKDAMSIYHYRPIYGVNEDQWWRYYPNNKW